MSRNTTYTLRRGDVEVQFLSSNQIAINFIPETEDGEIKEMIREVAAVVGVGVDMEEGEVEIDGEKLRYRFEPDPESPKDFTRVVELGQITGEEKRNAILNAFLRRDEVQWAGPVVARDDSTLAYLTNELIVHVADPKNVPPVLARAGEHGFKLLRVLPYALDSLHLAAETHPGYGVLTVADELMEIDGVLAEPNLAGTSEFDTEVAPRYNLKPELWDRITIRTEAAWERLAKAEKPAYGSQEIVLAVVDADLEESNPGLQEYELFDFRWIGRKKWKKSASRSLAPLRYQGKTSCHGMRVAGVAAAARKDGIVGVAPDCKVKGLMYPPTEIDVLDMYLWAAGIDPGSPRRGFPKLPRWRADIFITCMGFGFAKRFPITRKASYVLGLIARKGRRGKGGLLFFSAGNSASKVSRERPWAAHEQCFGIAASTLGADGREVRAQRSNHGQVKLCAPSSDGPLHRTVSIDTSGKGEGNEHTNNFGGTSSATPLAAGAAALVLSARPELPCCVVHEILRDSAMKIDRDTSDRIAQWLDGDGVPTKRSGKPLVKSQGYGFGRVDAAAAVDAALRFDGSLDCPDKETSSKHRCLSGLPCDVLALVGLSFVLGVHHLLFAGLLFWWPYGDGDGLGGLSVVLGLYHLVVAAVLWWFKGREPQQKDEPDDDFPAPATINPRPGGG